jgi:hypothetical protein
VCVRRLAQGSWPQEMRYGRFLANERVTVEALVDGWSDQTGRAVAGRHVLVLQDTSEIGFSTTPEHRRGLGKIKKGNAFGVLLHAALAVEAESGAVLGLAGGRVWTRDGDVTVPRGERPLAEKESSRWVTTAEEAKQTLAAARLITIVDDREGEFYAAWALTPGRNVHHLTRLLKDHALIAGGTLRAAVARLPVAATAAVELRERAGRRPRTAHLSLRFGTFELKRPKNTPDKHLAASVRVSVVEVIEPHPPAGAEPLHWILLTSHAVATVADAWQMVDWYKRRWTIEQLFRTMKSQGLRIEESQLETADRLVRLVAIAAKAATIVMQLVQGRDGHGGQPASLAFSPDEIRLIALIAARQQTKGKGRKNPYPEGSLAWAARVIAKLGGWNEHSARPPGPITFFNGLTYFRAFAAGWAFRDV